MITPSRSGGIYPGIRFASPCLRIFLVGSLLSTICASQPNPEASVVPDERREKPYALIFGTVWGPDSRPIYGVRVRIRRANERKSRWELYSDHNGEFAQRVPAGPADYLVWADLKGYKLLNGKKLQAGTEVSVHIENDERTDIGLHLR